MITRDFLLPPWLPVSSGGSYTVARGHNFGHRAHTFSPLVSRRFSGYFLTGINDSGSFVCSPSRPPPPLQYLLQGLSPSNRGGILLTGQTHTGLMARRCQDGHSSHACWSFCAAGHRGSCDCHPAGGWVGPCPSSDSLEYCSQKSVVISVAHTAMLTDPLQTSPAFHSGSAPPTKPGVYWSHSETAWKALLVEVRLANGELTVWWPNYDQSVTAVKGHWHGPIPPSTGPGSR